MARLTDYQGYCSSDNYLWGAGAESMAFNRSVWPRASSFSFSSRRQSCWRSLSDRVFMMETITSASMAARMDACPFLVRTTLFDLLLPSMRRRLISPLVSRRSNCSDTVGGLCCSHRDKLAGVAASPKASTTKRRSASARVSPVLATCACLASFRVAWVR